MLVQPTITPGRGRVTTRIGQSVRLFCDATGVPTPEILWQKDGQRVSPMEGFLIISDGMLQINDAQPSDAGRYDCIAKNGAGADVFKVILEVHGEFPGSNILLMFCVKSFDPLTTSFSNSHRLLYKSHLCFCPTADTWRIKGKK